VEQLGVDREDVTRDARLGEQLGADSLDAVQLTIELEEAFGIEIPDEDAQQLIRVGHVIDYITAHAGASVT
jgi:acyl carrier protein